MSGNPPVVIIGAGVGGLTLALLLRQRGIAAEVLEQSTELREVGAAVSLAANATRVMRHVGLGEALAQVSTEPTALIHRDGRDGHRIAVTPGPQWYRDTFGAPFVGLHRAALQRILADAFGPDHLHLDCRVESLEERGQGIRVRCSSGAVFEANLVVGADGVHSLVRHWVTGGTSRFTRARPGSAAWSRSTCCRGCPIPAPCSSGSGPARTCCTTRSTAVA